MPLLQMLQYFSSTAYILCVDTRIYAIDYIDNISVPHQPYCIPPLSVTHVAPQVVRPGEVPSLKTK